MEDLTKLCKHARSRKLARGEVMFECGLKKGTDYSCIPLLINRGDACVANVFYKTGHSTPNVNINTTKMNNCEYKEI
jgi:hypothetical protein